MSDEIAFPNGFRVPAEPRYVGRVDAYRMFQADECGRILWEIPRPLHQGLDSRGAPWYVYGPTEGRYLCMRRPLQGPLAVGDDDGGP